MNKYTENPFSEASKLVFNDQNLANYFTMLFYHYEYDLTNEDCFLEFEDTLSQINNLLLNRKLSDGSLLSDRKLLDEDIAIALSNRYIACLFYLLYLPPEKPDKETKEIIGILQNSSTMQLFSDISSEPFSDKIKTRNKEKWEAVRENLIKDNNERLKTANLSTSRLEDENEELKQRIEKGKKIWDDNKKLKEENEKLKLMLKKLGVNDPSIVKSSTDKDFPIQGQDTSSSQSRNIPVPDSNSIMTELSTPSKNNIDHTRSYAHTFRERGRFGSHPSHDDFGDESAP